MSNAKIRRRRRRRFERSVRGRASHCTFFKFAFDMETQLTPGVHEIIVSKVDVRKGTITVRTVTSNTNCSMPLDQSHVTVHPRFL